MDVVKVFENRLLVLIVGIYPAASFYHQQSPHRDNPSYKTVYLRAWCGW